MAILHQEIYHDKNLLKKMLDPILQSDHIDFPDTLINIMTDLLYLPEPYEAVSPVFGPKISQIFCIWPPSLQNKIKINKFKKSSIQLQITSRLRSEQRKNSYRVFLHGSKIWKKSIIPIVARMNFSCYVYVFWYFWKQK